MAKQKQQMTWGIVSPNQFRIFQTTDGGKILAEFKGVGALSAETLEFPEFNQAVERFRQSAALKRLEELRQQRHTISECLQQATEALSESRTEEAPDVQQITFAQQDVETFSEQLIVADDLIRLAYREAGREYEKVIGEARAQIFQTAKNGRNTAIRRFTDEAGPALTELLASHVRFATIANAAATGGPSLETILGPPPAATEVQADDSGIFMPMVGKYKRQGDPPADPAPEPKPGPILPEPVPMSR